MATGSRQGRGTTLGSPRNRKDDTRIARIPTGLSKAYRIQRESHTEWNILSENNFAASKRGGNCTDDKIREARWNWNFAG